MTQKPDRTAAQIFQDEVSARLESLERSRRLNPIGRASALVRASKDTAEALFPPTDDPTPTAKRWREALESWTGVMRVLLFRTTLATVGGGLVGALGIAVAVGGVWVAHRSNEHLQKQNKFLLTQIRQESARDYRGTRAQLFQLLYDRRPCAAGEQRPGDSLGKLISPEATVRVAAGATARPGCPAASLEARTAAAISLVQLERAAREDPESFPGVASPQRTNLTGVELPRAALQGAHLRDAILYGADLKKAHLVGADLRRATLQWADLRYADLMWTQLNGADLSTADLRGANLAGADLGDATITTFTKLDGCRFCPADTANPTVWPRTGAPKACSRADECGEEWRPRRD